MENKLLDQLTLEAVDLLKRLIATPSYSGKEEMVTRLIINNLEKNKIRFLQKGNNIWTYTKKSGKPKVLLNSHLDTVKPTAGWETNPFSAFEDEGKIFGLGANDAGASLVSMLMAYIALKDVSLPFELIFSATAEEEITGAMGMESILPLLGYIDLAIVGEPTEMKLAIGEKGLMVLDITTKGEVMHVAHANIKTAIDLAFDDYAKMKAIDFKDADSKLGKTKLTFSQILSGQKHNVTPAECKMVVDIRTNEILDNKKVLEIIQREVKSEVRARSTRLNASFISEEHPVVKLAKEKNIDCVTSNTISDQSVIPFPSVKIGPGKSERSHTPNEFVCVDEIRHGIKTYIEILQNLKF